MRRLSACLLIIAAGLLLLGFKGGGPSQEEARKIISQYFGYPKLLVDIIHAGPAGGQGLRKFEKAIKRLVKDGYLKKVPGAGPDEYYVPTSRSSQYIRGVYIKESFPLYEGAVCKEVVKKIDEILYDRQKNTAVITFTSGLEPIEPFYSLFCINKYCEYFGKRIKKTEKQKLRLVKYGEGWRLGE
jgi:hypothetical protein